MTNQIEHTVERYLAAWNETDPAHRRALVDELFAESAVYADPLVDVSGRERIDETIAAAQQQLGGLKLSLAGRVDAHHDICRFGWEVFAPGSNEPLVVGFDVIVVAQNGQVQRVLGFLDKVPVAA